MISSVGLAQNIELDQPKSGWRSSKREGVEFRQQVNYPASSVQTQEKQSQAALIEGRIRQTKKGNGEPYKLIVNGVAMPMRVDGDQFSRPYMFGSGSNSVEVRSPDNNDRTRLQFYEANPNVTKPALSVLLSWDTDGTDLDLHVISPDGQHCWYGQRLTANGGALDVDVTTGYGPEIFSTAAPLPGTWLVYLNYYGSGPRHDMTVAQITIVTKQNTVDEKKETLIVPMRIAGDLTLVKAFQIK
jgi:uncharacterized protein YfaP (DUF2135 family)